MAQGQVTPAGTFPLLVDIDSNGNVTVTDVDRVQYEGQLSGNKFSAIGTYPATFPGMGVFCSAANVTYQGTIVGGDITDITGSSNGTFTCTGPGGSLTVVLRGPFKVTRNVQGREILGGDDKGQAISNTLESFF